MQTTLKAQTIAIGADRLSVYDSAGAGPALVFLHGNASRWQHWEPQLLALAGRFRCIAFDQIGYGASSPLRQPNSISAMADTTAALCRALGVEHAYGVGLSMGGAVAQAVALRHPDLVDGLVVSGPPRLDVAPGPVPELTPEILRGLFGMSFSPAFASAHPEVAARVIDELLETDVATIRNFSAEDWPAIDPARIAAPTLVLAGEVDALAAPADCRQLAARIPGAEFHEFPGAGHMTNIEAAEDFNAALVGFVERHPARR